MADNLSNINHLEPGEEVIAIIHDYWIILVIPLVVYILGWVVFLSLYYVVDILKPVSFNVSFGALVFALIALLAAHHYFFIFYIVHFLSPLIVTNKRIIKIRSMPFFENTVIFVTIAFINEMDENRKGLLKNILNYGEVSFNNKAVKLQYIPYPEKFINLIDVLKTQKPLSTGDLKHMGATVPKKFDYLIR
jgi:hypothetical protein